MKNKIVGLIIAMVFLASGFGVGCTDYRAEYEELREEYVNVQNELNNTIYELAKTRNDLKYTEARLTSAQKRQSQLESQIEELREELDELRESLKLYGEVYKDIGAEVYGGVQPPYVKGLGQQVSLRNNYQARDPSWARLLEFLETDKTDEAGYSEYYDCGWFAEDLHNNAERAGIRAAWVALDFTYGESHAINAFATTDEGLVFIDCTGVELSLSHYAMKRVDIYIPGIGWFPTFEPPEQRSYDSRAYVRIGKEFGYVYLDELPYFKYNPGSVHQSDSSWNSMGHTISKIEIYW